jgi:hypothetical protein
MQSDSIRVRINFSQREVEVSGNNNQEVTAWWDRLDPIVQSLAQEKNGSSKNSVGDGGKNSSVPAAFGEYFHDFPSSITDVDKILAAAHFIQCHDADNSFTTAQVSKLLLEHNIKIGNPSQCVKQNVEKKHAFVFSGKYRVSKSGIDHLQELKTQPS